MNIHEIILPYCKRGIFAGGGGISRKCWQDLSHGGNFHNTTPFSLRNSYRFNFCAAEIFAKKAMLGKNVKITLCENFHVYSI